MNDATELEQEHERIETIKGGPIEYTSQTPIARARRHLRAAIAALESIYEDRIRQGANNEALDIDQVIYDLRRINGEHDTKPWAYDMSLARLEKQEAQP